MRKYDPEELTHTVTREHDGMEIDVRRFTGEEVEELRQILSEHEHEQVRYLSGLF